MTTYSAKDSLVEGIFFNARANEAAIRYCDSMATLVYPKDPKYHDQTKHVNILYRYIRDVIAQREMVFKHISITRTLANSLTKVISRNAFQSC